MATTPEWMVEAAETVLEPAANSTTAKIYELYKDENGVAQVVLFFDPIPHDYWIEVDGQRVDVPNVTTVLGKALDKSFALVPWGTKLTVETIRARLFNADGSINSLSTEEWNQLLEEAKNKHKEKLEDAGNIGKRAHDALEETIKEAIATTDGYVRSARYAPGLPEFYAAGSDVALELRLSMARSAYMAGLDFIRKHDVQFISTEKKVLSRSYFYTGTSDGVGWVTICSDPKCCRGYQAGTRVLACIDWKSSNQLVTSYALQTAAYVFAEIEESGLPITHRFINRLGKTDSSFEVWLCGPDLFEADLNTFLDCLKLYNSSNLLDERRKAEKDAVRQLVKAEKDKAKTAKLEAERLEKLAKKEALAAIKQADKAEREAAKAEAKLAKQAAKPSLALVVPIQSSVTTTVYAESLKREAQETKNAHTTSINDAVGENDHTGRVHSLAGDDVGVSPLPELPTVTKRGFDESFWEGGFSVGADGKVADIKASTQAKPGIAHTMHGNAEPRATRFWTTTNTYTIAGRIG
jgi:hypothetical protein